MDVDANKLADYMESPEGQKKLTDHINGDSVSASTKKGFWTVLGKMFCSFSNFSMLSVNLNIALKLHLDMTVKAYVLGQLGNTNSQINSQIMYLQNPSADIKAGFEQINYKLDVIEDWLKGEYLRDVNLLVKSKITDFSNMGTIGMWTQKRNEMNEFFGPNSDFQYHFDRAYDSALQRVECLNKRQSSPNYKRVPGNMLY
jgi:hypothetical protein